jgi:virginiamycin B lyase
LDIAAGPDGALWFTNGFDSSIGRITTTGQVTSFTDPAISAPQRITAGPDGALWFTNFVNNSIGRITTSGTVTEYTDPSILAPQDITTGSDGALWFTNTYNNSIGRITTAGAVSNFKGPGVSYPAGIAAGPDGALWFTNLQNHSIGRITTAGEMTRFTNSVVSSAQDIISGPDGALWFTNASKNSIGRVTPSGSFRTYSDPSISNPFGITRGPDGALWFTNMNNSEIGRITMSGAVADYPAANAAGAYHIATGSDGALWFTAFDGASRGSIGRLEPPSARDSCSRRQYCVAVDRVKSSTSTPNTAMTVTGRPDAGAGTVKVHAGPGTLRCSARSADSSTVGTVTTGGFTKAQLRVRITLRQTAGPNGEVCFHAGFPFTSKLSSTSGPNGGTGFLYSCASVKNRAPCVVSIRAVASGIVAILEVPGRSGSTFGVQWPRGHVSWLARFGRGRVGAAYTARIAAAGGVAPYRWKIVRGHLPPGLALNASSGAFRGKPRKAGSFPITVQATDAAQPPRKTPAQRVTVAVDPRSNG